MDGVEEFFFISLIPNSPKVVSILDGMSPGPVALPFFFIFLGPSSSRVWGPSSLLMKGGGTLSSWYNYVVYSDHMLRMSCFSIRMCLSFDHMHPGFFLLPLFFQCDLFYLLVHSFAVYSSVGFYFPTLCLDPMFLCFIAPLFYLFV